MNKTKIIFGIGAVALLVMLAVEPIAISTSKEIIEKDSEVTPAGGSVYVGEMYISGNGHYDTADVRASAVEGLIIRVDPEGSDVVFKADYYMSCRGLLDYGYVELRVEGADSKSADTDHYDEGTFYTTVYNCKPGHKIGWVLYAFYDDVNFYLPPIETSDEGWGICAHPRSRNRETSTPLFLQILENYMGQILDTFPLLKQLINRLQSNTMAIKGTIICE